MSTLKEIPPGFVVTSIDVRGDVMYIEGRQFGSYAIDVVPIKLKFTEEEDDERGTTTRSSA